MDVATPGLARITVFDPGAAEGDHIIEEDVETEAKADELIERLHQMAGTNGDRRE